MSNSYVEVIWPNGNLSKARIGSDWLKTAQDANVIIPTGCCKGSCGACEIEVNGEMIRACINKVKSKKNAPLKVKFASDPYW